jgi:hypothetical protein
MGGRFEGEARRMARVVITYWRDIPVLVTAREGPDETSLPLSPRFQDLADSVAMLEGLSESAQYLAQWRTGPAEEHPGPPEPVARAVAAALEERFVEIRAQHLRSAPD